MCGIIKWLYKLLDIKDIGIKKWSKYYERRAVEDIKSKICNNVRWKTIF